MVGQITSRGQDAFFEGMNDDRTDQQFRNVIFDVFENPITGKRDAYIKPWCSWTTFSSPSSPSGIGTGVIAWTGKSASAVAFAYGNTNSTIYVDTTGYGAITGQTYHMSESKVSDIPCVAMTSTDSTGWYLMSNANQAVFTGTLSSGSPTVTSVSSVSGLYSGQEVSGTGITAGTRILSVDSSSQITLNANATANGAQSITPGGVAKILDADYPGNAGYTVTGEIAFLDGFPFVMTTLGRIHSGNINTIHLWTATDTITLSDDAGGGVACKRYKDYIVGFGKQTTEFFYNAGNSFGSPLTRVKGSTLQVGATTARGVLSIMGTIAFVGRGKETGVGIYVLDGMQAKRISNRAIDARLAITDSINALYRISHQGKILLGVQFSTVYTSIAVYDFQTGLWSFTDLPVAFYAMTTLVDKEVGTFPFNVNYDNSTVALASGQSYILRNRSAFQAMTVITDGLDFDTNNRKRMKRLTLICDRATSSANAEVSYSDDDFLTWTTARTLDISTGNPTMRSGGTFRKRAFRIVWPTSATTRPNGQDAPRLKAIDVEYDEALV